MKAKKLALMSVLTALAMLLSYVERLIPVPIPVPGLKLGLPNLVTLYALYALGFWSAAAVTAVRCALIAILFASPAQLAFSLTGGLLALLIMQLLIKINSPYGVSMAGAAAHHIGQVSVAAVLMQTSGLVSYLAFLLPASIPTGLIIAFIYLRVEKRLPDRMRNRGLGF